MSPGNVWMVLMLLLAVAVSGIATAHAKYVTRIQFSALQELRAKRDALDVEWNRLRLEEAALSTDVRVAQKARDELGMYLPRVDDVLMIEEAGHDAP